MPKTNSMQVNAGLGASGIGTADVMSPAQAAIKLNEQAVMRQVQSQQIMQGTTMGMPSAAAFGEQFQQEMQRIQMQQMSPYMAQAMGRQTPSQPQYQQGMMPSPMMMTPPSTGNFRPPMSGMQQSASIPPMQALSPLSGISPFQPQRPAPMFHSPQDIRRAESDVSSARNFSRMAQAPQVMGQAAGFAGGAAIGASMGSRFGPMGAVAGAVGGAALAGFSGVAGGMGQMAQMPMQPMIQQRQMGAALQRTSKNFVIGGPQLHESGSGLSRTASIDLAGQFQQMSSDKGFQKETGGMFNAQDLMKITDQGGQAGLMDMSQSVPEIKNKVRETAATIKQFMAITNDPDITNVIRQMGQMGQMGMSQQDMTKAAQGMKTYSRMAGTSMNGIQQMGGLSGAATFSQAGMTPSTGFNYGNFAAASARQFVASGGTNPRELALMGGVSGIAQRDMQAQAASTAMPMYAMSNAQWQGGASEGGQWGLNKSGVGSTQGGAFGMVNRSLQAARQGVKQGGLGALAMMPAQQREISDLAMRQMAPEQAMAQRFGNVQATAGQMGLTGSRGFGAAAIMLHGQEVGEQMWRQAKSPEFWSAQKQQLKGRKTSLALQQADERRSNRGVLETAGDFVGLGKVGREAGRAWDDATSGSILGMGDVGGAISRKWDSVTDSISGEVSDFMLSDDVVRRHTPSGAAIDSKKERDALKSNVSPALDYAKNLSETAKGAPGELSIADLPNLGRALAYSEPGQGLGAGVGGRIMDPLLVGGGRTVAEGAQGAVAMMSMSDKDARKVMQGADAKRSGVRKLLRGAKKADAGTNDASYDILARMGDKNAGKTLAGVGKKLESLLDEGGHTGMMEALFGGAPKLTPARMEAMARKATGKTEAEWGKLSPTERTTLTQEVWSQGQKDSQAVKDLAIDTEGDISVELAQNVDDAAEADAEAYDVRREKSGEDLDLESWTGAYKDGVKGDGGLLEQISNQSVDETVMLTAAARGDELYDEAFSKWEAAGGKGGKKAFQKKFNAAKTKLSKMGGDVQDRYEDMAKSEGGLDEAIRFANDEKDTTTKEALRSAAEGLEDYADPEKLTKITHNVSGKITGKNLADAMTDEGLQKMIDEGRGDEVDDYLLAQGGGAKGKAAAGRIEQRAIDGAAEGTTDDDAAVTADGDEADKLDDAEGAIKNLSAMFADFKPAIKDFKAASSEFKEAMDSGGYMNRTE